MESTFDDLKSSLTTLRLSGYCTSLFKVQSLLGPSIQLKRLFLNGLSSNDLPEFLNLVGANLEELEIQSYFKFPKSAIVFFAPLKNLRILTLIDCNIEQGYNLLDYIPHSIQSIRFLPHLYDMLNVMEISLSSWIKYIQNSRYLQYLELIFHSNSNYNSKDMLTFMDVIQLKHIYFNSISVQKKYGNWYWESALRSMRDTDKWSESAQKN